MLFERCQTVLVLIKVCNSTPDIHVLHIHKNKYYVCCFKNECYVLMKIKKKSITILQHNFAANYIHFTYKTKQKS